MTLGEIRKHIEKCREEITSLTEFSHDNQYVGSLIIRRIEQLQSEIKVYEKLLVAHTNSK
jgi:hypothetical protein